MATEDKNVKVTEEYAPDGSLIKKTLEHPPKKSFTDWVAWFAQVFASLAVVIAIIALVLGANQFKEQQSNSAQMQATQVAASTMQSLDQQHQTILDTYLDRMSDLLLTYHLSASKPGDEVRALAQARTYTALRNLDGTRKGTLVRFLWGAELINGFQPIISMLFADLSGAMLGGADMSGINLSGAILACSNQSGQKVCADLSGSRLCGLSQGGQKVCADLSGAILAGTNLSGAILSCAKLTGGQKGCADLSGAYLCGTERTLEKGCADLSGAYLDGADLRGAILCGVGLDGQKGCADLSGAHLEGTNLNNETDLRRTLLRGASYNTKPFQLTDLEGYQVTLGPTQWPKGFDPKVAGAICDDC
jgi:uncharacterized protein YjbI with pentapeptide repeats